MPNFSDRNTHAIDPLFSQRWSPRKYINKEIPEADLSTIFSAARLSPSCFNEQPWRFITSRPESHDKFLALLVEANQAWAKHAAIIGFIVFDNAFARNGNANMHAGFDTGAAWMAMSLQASMLGYQTHGMGGINYEAVYQAFDIDPAQQTVSAGFTIGTVDPATDESLSERKPLSDIWQQV